MNDHYQTLGVERNAGPEDLKRAYRKLAAKHHPDRGGDTAAFQEIQAAYDTLSDPQKRAAYDSPQPNFGPAGFDIHDIFSSMFGRGFQQPGRQPRGHVRMSLWVNLYDVAVGGKRTVNLGTSQGTNTVEIEIPLGINNGDNVQYGGIGPGGADLVVQYRVHPHQDWERHGLNLITERKVPIWDLILGSSITVNSITNSQLVAQIPTKCQPGTMLRLKGQGLKDRSGNQGDVYVRVAAFLPTDIAPEIIDAIQAHRK